MQTSDEQPAVAADSDQAYRIGAVERLTGVPAVTIRMWERRYGAVVPERTEANGRLYSRAQVARLAMLKQLVDAGHAISTVAGLSDMELGQRLGDMPDFRPALAGPLAVVLVGEGLCSDWAQVECPLSVVLARHSSLETAVRDEALSADVLLVEVSLVGPDTRALLQQAAEHFSATVVVLIYQFGSNALIERLHRSGVHTMMAPVRMAELRRMLPPLLGATPRREDAHSAGPVEWMKTPPPPRRFSDLELRRWARQAQAVRCECPEHLASLITRLTAFEDYSRDCESRNSADAAVHALLHHTSAQARRMMEDALQHLIEHEFGVGATAASVGAAD